MKFDKTLTAGILLRRYKRFLADVELADGTIVTAHTPNTGAMTGCCTPGSRVWLMDSENPARKYPFTWELVETAPGILAGINTGRPNKLVREAIENGIVSELQGYAAIRTEVKYGRENSRIDLLLENSQADRCYVEVKNVTLVEAGAGFFPDAVSQRGSKHLRELAEMATQGHRSIIFYCLQRQDAAEVRPADAIDPVYGETLRQALEAGVEALAYQAVVTTRAISLSHRLPFVCP